MNKQIKNILIIGKTGNGKSTLANVLSNTNLFVESSGSTSQTKTLQAEQFEHQGQTYQVIDTLGLSDTSLTEKEVLFKIAEIANYLENGQLCQVLFVIDKRISKEEQEVYKLLKEVILTDNETKELVTLVRSNFAKFRKPDAVSKDLEKIKQDPALAEIITNCRDIIYLNNPSLEETGDEWDDLGNEYAKKMREVSRQIMLDYLIEIPNYQVKNITEIKDRVDNYRTELELVQKALDTTKEEQKKLIILINSLQEEIEAREINYQKKLTQLEKISQAEQNELKRQIQVEQLSAKKRVTELKLELLNFQSSQAKMEDYQNDLQKEVTTLQERNRILEGKISGLEQDNSSLQSQRENLQARVEQLETRWSCIIS